MFDSISEIKKHFIVHDERNSVALIITKIYSNKIIFGTKYELFIPLYQITFFLGFGQTRIFFSSHTHIILWQKENIKKIQNKKNISK